MRAIYYDRQGPAGDVLRFGELPRPRIGAGEVLVRVHVSAVNPSDVKNRIGFVGPMRYPRIIPHQDGAGIVEAVGAGVTPERIGERVWIYEAQTGRAAGTAAEYVAVPAQNAVPLPEEVSFEVGATLGVPAMTAHRCLFADGRLEGRRVLVHGGAGAVGAAAIQLATWRGARVVATVRRAEQVDAARRAGAESVLVSGSADTANLRTALGDCGADRIVDVAVNENLDIDLAALADGGVISAYSTASPSDEVCLPMVRAMVANAAVRFVYVYTVPVQAKVAAVADIDDCLRNGGLRPRIGLVVPLARTAEAHLAVEAGAAAGRVLIRVVDEPADQ
ncbi:NADPH:quinone reductase [Mycolicibacterium sp. J2]|uniref:NADPH:quinone reductase n=1 Tax=Mycolicibacterium sp. J2 TaxID=2993511 RepID=UPI00224B9BAB|nr:NADPH:quinone reductase [Mycolicibacterium sp. J2]MCX2713601.1 NADPH:quinone reductase [Mycolicibacterium sp. J2]